MTEKNHKLNPIYFKLSASEESVINHLLSSIFCNEHLNLPNHSILLTGTTYREISAYEKAKCFGHFLLCLSPSCMFFFKHWKCGMFYRIRSLEISVPSNIVSLFIFLRDVNMVSCMNCLELWGDVASPAALNRCSEDRNF